MTIMTKNVDLLQHLERGMTVGELREALSNFDDAAYVVFAYNYGDYWHTKVAEVVRHADAGDVRWSRYHNQPKLLDPEDEPSEDEDEDETVVVLNLR